jgi:hypothetical protein
MPFKTIHGDITKQKNRVGPIYRGGGHGEEKLLRDTYISINNHNYELSVNFKNPLDKQANSC